MSHLRLHFPSWFVLLAVSLQLLYLNGLVAVLESRWHTFSVGFPKYFHGVGYFHVHALVLDIRIWLLI